MKFCSSSSLLVLLLSYITYEWFHVHPRVEWEMSSQMKFEKCPNPDVPVVLMFGATSMLGKYVVSTLKKEEDICLISLARSSCRGCDIQVKGDVRDARLIERVLKFYKPETVLTSIKPPLMNIHYKTYIEINLLSMIQMIDLSKQYNVKNFIYVSSIAAAGHYFDHYNAKESDSKPFYTDFEAPYDISKRFTEDYLLREQSKHFNVIAIRVGGIVGGSGDPYEHLRYPVMFEFHPPTPGVDVNYAGNVAKAVDVVYKRMANLKGKECDFCGEFYYYTGEPMTENEKGRIVSEVTGKPVVPVPRMPVHLGAKLLHWARFDPNIYNPIDMVRMGMVPQTFDQSKFFKTFPEFKPVMSLKDALKKIYASPEGNTDL